jgi:hypothetical protein
MPGVTNSKVTHTESACAISNQCLPDAARNHRASRWQPAGPRCQAAVARTPLTAPQLRSSCSHLEPGESSKVVLRPLPGVAKHVGKACLAGRHGVHRALAAVGQLIVEAIGLQAVHGMARGRCVSSHCALHMWGELAGCGMRQGQLGGRPLSRRAAGMLQPGRRRRPCVAHLHGVGTRAVHDRVHVDRRVGSRVGGVLAAVHPAGRCVHASILSRLPCTLAAAPPHTPLDGGEPRRCAPAVAAGAAAVPDSLRAAAAPHLSRCSRMRLCSASVIMR